METRTTNKIIRRATHAGDWYSGSGKELDLELSTYLEKAQRTLPFGTKLRAIIGPHAGFAYSGPTAAWAYKNIEPIYYDRVVLLGPSHKVALDFIGTTTCTDWATPLGNLKVDTETIDQLVAAGGKDQFIDRIGKKYEENEHSLEMHIPYI